MRVFVTGGSGHIGRPWPPARPGLIADFDEGHYLG